MAGLLLSLPTAAGQKHPPLCVGINLSEERDQPFPSLLHRLLARQLAVTIYRRPLYRLCCFRLRPRSEGQHSQPTIGGTGTMLMIKRYRVLYMCGSTAAGYNERT